LEDINNIMKIYPYQNYTGLWFLLFIILSLLTGCLPSPFVCNLNTSAFLDQQSNEIGLSSQILLVEYGGSLISPKIKLYAMEKQKEAWIYALEPFNAVIGRNGFAPEGEKREGDGRTPSGIYPLKLAFGYPESVNTKMPYRQALSDDIWVDDPDADDYNRWTKINQTRAVSFEMMRREDNLYKYGVVIEYNTAPVIKENGSAIFLHIWKEKGAPTAGCVAVAEENMIKILEWLDPEKSPVIITGIHN